MASTYSKDLRIELIDNGSQAGVWGTTTNTNLGTLIEDAISGNATVSVTASPRALTALNGAVDEARQAILTLTTTLTAAFTVLAPPVPKQYVVYNNTAYTATIGNATVINGTTPTGGTTVAIPAGRTVTVWSDGSNISPQNNHLPGVPTSATAAPETNTTQVATTAHVFAANANTLTALSQVGPAKGANLVGFIQSGTGAVARTVQAKVREVVSVKDFGAIGNGVADDTAAIQAALNSGTSVFMPSGTYRITSALVKTGSGSITGEGVGNTIILVIGSGYDAITFTGSYSGICELELSATQYRTAGAYVRFSSTTRGNFAKYFRMQNGFIGIYISAETVITYIENGEILNCTPGTGVGILIGGGNDTFINNVVMDNNPSAQPSAGIRITKSQAVFITDTDCIHSGTALSIAPNGAIGEFITWLFFNTFAGDSGSGDGISITPSNGGSIRGLFFDNCWSSTNRRGVFVSKDIPASVIDGVFFTDSTFVNNVLEGALVTTGNNTEFNNCRVSGNSGAVSAASAGIAFANNLSNFAVRGTRSGAIMGFVVSQSCGVSIGTGCDSYTLTDNNFFGNATTAVIDDSAISSVTREVRGNLGYKTVSSAVALLLAGQNQVNVPHGLAGQPSVVLTTPKDSNLNGASFWAGTFTDTNFNINTSANVTVNSAFSWQASLYN